MKTSDKSISDLSGENKAPSIAIRGCIAVEHALHYGLPLYYLNPQGGWVKASIATAARMYAHPDCILASYGIERPKAKA